MTEETIWRLDDAEQIATEEIIPKFHPDLADITVIFLATSKTRTSGGKEVWAKTTKLSPSQKFLAGGADVQVLISADVWEERLTDTQKRALIDHELSHLVVVEDEDTGDRTLRYRAHDVEEFGGVLQRWGAWNSGVAEFAHIAAQQLALPLS